jgi:cbb3-type cytochrome oxidase maturation protein
MLSYMDVLYLLVPLGCLVTLAIGAAFAYAALGGQFDDLEQPALDVVADDDKPC